MTDILDKCLGEIAKANLIHKHGAVIIRQGCEIVTGHNYMMMTRHFKSVHAEVNAIEEFKKRYPKAWLKKSVLVVMRANNNGELRNSAPCAACQKYVRKHNIPKVYYSTD